MLKQAVDYIKNYPNKGINMTGKEIREIRFKLGLTQAQLARKLGVTISSIIRWENNKSSPSPLAERAIDSLTSDR